LFEIIFCLSLFKLLSKPVNKYQHNKPQLHHHHHHLFLFVVDEPFGL